jgi:colicin import membrane protein
VKIASNGSDQAAIARVVIAFARESETDVQLVGETTLVVRVRASEPPGDSVPPQASSDAARLAAEKKQQEEAARLAAEEKKRQEDEAREKKLAEQKAREEAARLAAEEKKRQEDEARQKRLAEQKEREEAARVAAEKKRQEDEARQKRLPTEKARDDREAVRGPGTVESFGFKQLDGRSRVFVRTSSAVNFSVREDGPNLVVLELQDTKIGKKNNRRFLDTSFFDTPVELISPQVEGSAVRIAIRLKSQVQYAARQEGGEIFVDFQRPGEGVEGVDQ